MRTGPLMAADIGFEEREHARLTFEVLERAFDRAERVTAARSANFRRAIARITTPQRSHLWDCGCVECEDGDR